MKLLAAHLITLLILVACQVSEKSPTGTEIISGHTPYENTFSVLLPTNGWKKLNDNLDIKLTFPVAVTATGTPRIPVTVGATSKYFTYVSGSGTSTLTFRYTVGATDVDVDGVVISGSIDLNGGSLTFSNGGVRNTTTTVTVPSHTIRVDGIVPVVSTMTPPADGTYVTNALLVYQMAFSEPVYLNGGSASFNLIMSSGNVPASYTSGQGTTNLSFTRLVRSTDLDEDGISTSTAFNGAGILRDIAGNLVATALSPVNSPGIIVNSTGPQIISVTPPANGLYLQAQNMDFTVVYDEAVNVTGTPSLNVNLTTGTVQANYLSGSGTDTLVFRHTVLTGEQDQNGVVYVGALALNGGSIRTLDASADAILSFSPPSGASVNVDAKDPLVTMVNNPSNGTYSTGQTLSFGLAFDETVTVTGTPRLPFVVGATTRYLNYVSGSGSSVLTFSYTIPSGELDADGVQLNGTIDLNGGTIRDGISRNAVLTYTPSNTTGILIDSAQPSILSITPPADGTYMGGQNLNFTANFSKTVVVTGTPRLAITLGASTVYANYLSGSGTAAINFRYVVQNNDLDTNGIVLNSPLQLNGGTIINGGSNNAVLTFTSPNTSNILVDAVLPVLSNVTVPANNTYGPGQDLTFTAVFNKNMVVTGTPRIPLVVGANNVYATFVSGNGTTNLVFKYNLQSGDVDNDGIVHSSPIELNGGTIQDDLGSSPGLTFAPANTSAVLVDNVMPEILSITPPIAKTYSQGENMDFTVAFNKTIEVTGTPRISITVGAATVYANYLSGDGTANLVFRYTPALNAVDLDGIALNSPVELNGGNLEDTGGLDSDLDFTAPDTSAVLVNAVVPAITSVTPPADDTYGTGEFLDFTVNFNKSVVVTGTPRINITLGAATVYATYQSGSGSSALVFRYTVVANDVDANGVDVNSPLDLNAGTIKDSGAVNATLTITPPNTAGVLVDAVAPTISSVTPPSNGTYVAAQNLDFTAVFSKTVTITGTPRIQLTLGAATVYANYVSGSGTANILFRYTVQSNDSDTNGIASTSPVDLNSGTIKDASNNSAVLTFTAPNTTAVLVDAVLPVISSITPPADATYLVTQNINFTVNFNKPITVTGTPRLNITLGAATVYANYLSGSGTSALVFRYTVVNTNYDTNGIVLNSPVELNGGTLKDAVTNDASLTFSSPNLANVKVDALLPAISSVLPPTNGTYEQNQNLDFQVTFNKPVDITGTPRLSITLGAATVYATYLSGSGTDTVNFRYVIQAGDSDTNGIALNSPAQLNSGTIKDSLNNNSSLTFTPPNTTGVLVDGVLPSILSVTPPANATYAIGQTLSFTVNANKNIVVTGTPRIELTVGASTFYANYVSGTGSSNLVFSYTVLATHSDTNGIAVVSPLDLNSGSLKDSLNNNLNLTFTPPTTTSVLVDGIVPTISSVTPPSNAWYKATQQLNFTVNWSENVTVTGTPRIQIDVGGTTVYATYVSGSGSNATIFRYTPSVGHLDTNGIVLTSPIDLNSGTITDVPGNTATLTYTLPTTTGVLVDGVVPTITSVTAPANSTYTETSNVDFTVNWSENVTVSGSPRIQLNVGGATLYATYVSGSGSSATIFRYTVGTGDEDLDGIASSSPIGLNSGTIRDAATNDATLTFTPPTTTAVLVDGKAPTITSVTTSNTAVYHPGENIDITFNYHEPVTVTTPAPSIQVTIDGVARTATYVSGTGTSALVFRYTVAAANAELDLDGLTTNTTINNNNKIKDPSNHQSGSAFTAPDMSGVKVLYSNTKMWIDFDDAATITTAACAANNCVTGATDKSGSGNNISTGTNPGPVLQTTGYGTAGNATRGFAQFNNTASLTMPNIANVKYFLLFIKSHTVRAANNSTLQNNIIGGSTNVISEYTSTNIIGSTTYSHKANANAVLKLNLGTASAAGTSIATTWVLNTQYGMQVTLSTALTLNSHTIGSNTFNGQVVAVMALDSSAALSAAQLDELTTQMNSLYAGF